MYDPLKSRAAVASLVFARIVYAINWLNIGAIYVLMSPTFGVGTSGLGTLTSAFYLGLGLMQIPGGLLTAKWGPKRVVVLGIFLSSLSVLGTAASSSLMVTAVLRFLVGTGMACVFAPGVVLVARHLKGNTGLGVGLFNSAYDFGGVLGIFGWVVIATAEGWRQSLLLSGVLGLITGILVIRVVPPDEGRSEFRVKAESLKRILMSRQLTLLGLVTFGLSVGNVLISSFMVEYLVNSLHYAPVIAGSVGSMVVVLPIFTAIWAGRAYARVLRPRLVLTLVVLGSALALFLCSFPSIYTALGCSVLGGIAAGIGYTFAFSGAKDLNSQGGQYDGLAISWVNAIQLTGDFVPPLFYTYFVDSTGYSAAWGASALLCFVFVVPLFFMVGRFRD